MPRTIRPSTRFCLVALVAGAMLSANSGSAQERVAPAKPARDKPTSQQAAAGPTATADTIMGLSTPSAEPAAARAQSAAPKPATPSKIEPLPAFPRHPGLYHRGTTEFFLDCPEALSDGQFAALTGIKAKASRELADADKKIAAGERELYKLTAAGSPDAATVAAKIGEVERARAQRRMRFIRRVGEAATVLTDEQRAAMINGPAPAAPGGKAPGAKGTPQAEGADGE